MPLRKGSRSAGCKLYPQAQNLKEKTATITDQNAVENDKKNEFIGSSPHLEKFTQLLKTECR